MTKDEEKDEPVVWGASVLSKPEYIAEQKAKTKELRNMMDESIQTVPNFDQLQQIVNNLERCLTRDSKHEFLRVWIRDWTEHKLSKRTSAALEAKDEPVTENGLYRLGYHNGYGFGEAYGKANAPQRKPLTDAEVGAIAIKSQDGISPHDDTLRFARTIEAAHGIKGEA